MNTVRAAKIGSHARALAVACVAHVMHDGYTDLLYILLPIWQREYALSLAAVGLLRTLYTGAMALFQVPASIAGERAGPRTLLASGTAFSAAAYLAAGMTNDYAGLAVALFAGGLGSSVQHPLASNMVAHAFEGARSRLALGTYNFSGDIGKMAFPALVATLLIFMPWREVLFTIAAIGGCVALGIAVFAPQVSASRKSDAMRESAGANGERTFTRGFSMLLSIGAIDSATRMGFLTFLPFVLTAKGAAVQTVGLCLVLIFAGGAAGKFVCAFLGARIGVFGTVFLTESLTALGILALLPLPLWICLIVLPVIGIALNGTSSALYGTVPELVPVARRQRAFGIFYTGTIGAGAISPAISGAISDARGVPFLMCVVAAFVLLTIPLARIVRRAGVSA